MKTWASWIIDLMKARHVKVPKKGRFLSFCNKLRKSIATVFVFCSVFVMFVTTYFCKHSNCPDFARTVLVFGMLSQCPGLNQFVPIFIFLTKKCSYLHNFLSAV